MTTLQLYFLGPLDIRSDDRQLPRPPTLKSQSLLAYLVCHRRQPQPRDQLAGLFFGETTEHKARRSLSTALWHIHRCLPKETTLLNESQTVQFDPMNSLWLDVEEFEAHAAGSDAASLHAAVALYRGDFLEGFYDDWIINERYRLEALYLDALARLMVIYEAGRNHQAALATALRLLSRDAIREDAHQAAMRAYCRLGQRKAALDQYERCRDTVLKELGAQPIIETRDLYQAILDGRFEATPQPHALPTQPLPAGPAGRHPLDLTATVRLVGRDLELLFLQDAWQKAQAGTSHLALISGEVGVGKTRLVEEFANRLRWQGTGVLWGRCYEFERALPYQPLVDALRNFLPMLPGDQLAGFPVWALREVARLVPELLERPGLKKALAETQRRFAADSGPQLLTGTGLDLDQARLFAGVARVLSEVSAREALLVVLEDLHWASDSALQMLHHLVRHLSGHPVLMIGTFRPEAAGSRNPIRVLYQQLAREGLAQQLDLARLSPSAVETIIADMSGAGEAVLPLAQRLYRETEGNPFFLMEIVKALFEENIIQLKEGAWQGEFSRISAVEFPLSSSVSEAVQARVQRLGEDAQEGLRLAAVLGYEFSYELLQSAWGKGEEATLEMLDELLRHRLVEEKAGLNDSDFAFTHHKIQEIIYQGLPLHRRFHLHAQVGSALEILYPAELETRAGELAHHFEQACRIDPSFSGRALTYLLRAGQRAVRQFANQEAVSYYQRGLDLLRKQPGTEQNLRQELDLQLALAVPTTVIFGYASPETKHVYERARDLCQRLSQTPELFTSLVGLARYYGLNGDFETERKLGEQILDIAIKSNDIYLLIEAYREKGNFMSQVEGLKKAREAWERSLALYNLAGHERNAYRFGHDPAVTCLGYLGMLLWLSGYPEQSLARSQNLCDLIPAFTHPSSQAYGYCHLALHACYRSAAQACYDYAEAAIQLSQLHGLSSWMILATVLKGWALFEQRQELEGMALLKEGIQAFRARGFVHLTPFLLTLQAGACLKLRQLDDGTNAVLTALEIIKGNVDRYWEAEFQRLHGELLWAQGIDECAEKHFHQAIALARQHETRMLELRAAASLARLWQSQGRAREARQALSAVYDQFTEGFEACDLQAARNLLRELS